MQEVKDEWEDEEVEGNGGLKVEGEPHTSCVDEMTCATPLNHAMWCATPEWPHYAMNWNLKFRNTLACPSKRADFPMLLRSITNATDSAWCLFQICDSLLFHRSSRNHHQRRDSRRTSMEHNVAPPPCGCDLCAMDTLCVLA